MEPSRHLMTEVWELALLVGRKGGWKKENNTNIGYQI